MRFAKVRVMTMAQSIYRNGPLPTILAHRAYIAAESHEFALPHDAALAYLEWCSSHRYAILGLETWLPTSPGPTAIAGAVAEGGTDVCRDAMTRYIAMFGPDIVFNISTAVPSGK